MLAQKNYSTCHAQAAVKARKTERIPDNRAANLIVETGSGQQNRKDSAGQRSIQLFFPDTEPSGCSPEGGLVGRQPA